MKKLLPLLLLAFAGCGTVMDAVGNRWCRDDGPAPHVFGGTRGDWRMLSGDAMHAPILFPLCAIDLPLSVAGDIILLPVSGAVALFSSDP